MEGESMSEWKEVKLEEILIIYDKKRRPLSSIQRSSFQGQYRYYGAQGIIDYIADYIFDGEYMLIAEDGENLNSRTQPIAQIVNGKFWVNNHAHIVRTNDKANMYLVMLILNNLNISSYVTGAAQPKLNQDNLKRISIYLPNKNEQDIIAGILSSLDAKIETNNKLNEKLEEMAQAIFKSWFVDFEPFKDKPFHETELGMIPEGWEVGSLSDIATITMGQSPCGTSYNENGEGIIFYQGRTEFGFRFPSIRLYTTAPSRFAEVGSTLMSVRAPVGDINMALLRCCIGRGVASIKSNCDCDSYIYYLMKSLKKRFDIYNGEGTVFGSVGRDTLRGLLITIPPSSVISDFEMNISKIDSRIKTNELESKRLASLRDTLLPRLMSGELIV